MPDHSSSRVTAFILKIALPFLGLVAICLINSWLAKRLFGVGISGYLKWYVNTGPFINLAVAAFGAAWSAVDNNIGLVSAHPLTYIRACSKLAGLPIYAARRASTIGEPPRTVALGSSFWRAADCPVCCCEFWLATVCRAAAIFSFPRVRCTFATCTPFTLSPPR